MSDRRREEQLTAAVLAVGAIYLLLMAVHHLLQTPPDPPAALLAAAAAVLLAVAGLLVLNRVDDNATAAGIAGDVALGLIIAWEIRISWYAALIITGAAAMLRMRSHIKALARQFRAEPQPPGNQPVSSVGNVVDGPGTTLDQPDTTSSGTNKKNRRRTYVVAILIALSVTSSAFAAADLFSARPDLYGAVLSTFTATLFTLAAVIVIANVDEDDKTASYVALYAVAVEYIWQVRAGWTLAPVITAIIVGSFAYGVVRRHT